MLQLVKLRHSLKQSNIYCRLSIAGVLFKQIKSGVMETMRGKLGGVMLKPVFGKIKDKMNPDEYGGAPLLGLDGAVVKAHGSSNGYAFSRAIFQARKMVMGDIVGTIKQGLNDIQEV